MQTVVSKTVETCLYKIVNPTEIKNRRMDTTMETMSRLKLIASLKRGEKINTKTVCVQPDNFMTSISRKFYNQDNRTNMISFVEETIGRSFDIIERYKKSENQTDIILCDRIIEDLILSLSGLERLKETYASDSKVICDLDTFIQIVDAKLLSYCENYQERRKRPTNIVV